MTNWGDYGSGGDSVYVADFFMVGEQRMAKSGKSYPSVSFTITPLKDGLDMKETSMFTFSKGYKLFEETYNEALGLPSDASAEQRQKHWRDSYYAEYQWEKVGEYKTKDQDGNTVVKDNLGIRILQIFPDRDAAMAYMNGGTSQPQEAASEQQHPDVEVVAGFIKNIDPTSMTRETAENKIASVLINMGDNVKVTDMAIQSLLDDKFESDDDDDIPFW